MKKHPCIVGTLDRQPLQQWKCLDELLLIHEFKGLGPQFFDIAINLAGRCISSDDGNQEKDPKAASKIREGEKKNVLSHTEKPQAEISYSDRCLYFPPHGCIDRSSRCSKRPALIHVCDKSVHGDSHKPRGPVIDVEFRVDLAEFDDLRVRERRGVLNKSYKFTSSQSEW